MDADYVNGPSSLASSKWQCMMETNSYKQELAKLRMAVEGFSHLLERQADKYNKVTKRYKTQVLIFKKKERRKAGKTCVKLNQIFFKKFF
jgi:hypothetical protein